MTSKIVALSLLLAVAACTRNPGGDRPRSSSSDEAETAAAEPEPQAPAAHDLPAGHPPLDDFQMPSEQAGGPTGPFDPAHPAVAGITFEAPAPLTYQQPSSRMRIAEYVVEGADDGTVMTIFHFPGGGGGVQANVDRWVGQFDLPEGEEADVATRTVNELPVTTVDVSGTFGGGMAMPGRPAPAAADDQRMLAAIVEGPSGPVFFKMVGPAATVGRAEEAFEALVSSFAAAGS